MIMLLWYVIARVREPSTSEKAMEEATLVLAQESQEIWENVLFVLVGYFSIVWGFRDPPFCKHGVQACRHLCV